MQTANRKQAITSRLQTRYEQEVVPALQQQLGVTNRHAVPQLEKIVVNVGAGQAARDPKILETVKETLTRITGQKPVMTKAKQSISNFKIRKGMGIGVMVTLRGRRMYDFLDKLIHISLPRVRDFQGLSPAAFDQRGNYTLAFREHNVFPEISGDTVETLHGLQVTICTSAADAKSAELLLRQFGLPLQTTEERKKK